ncbi:hypothetical protein ACFL04_04580 [Patescibacteria group bacterium]
MSVKKNTFKGHVTLPRSLLREVSEGKITPNDFTVLCMFIGIVDWDENHKLKFAGTNISNAQFKRDYMPKLSEATISRTKNILVEIGHLAKAKDFEDQRITNTWIPEFKKYQPGRKKQHGLLNDSASNMEHIPSPDTDSLPRERHMLPVEHNRLEIDENINESNFGEYMNKKFRNNEDTQDEEEPKET